MRNRVWPKHNFRINIQYHIRWKCVKQIGDFLFKRANTVIVAHSTLEIIGLDCLFVKLSSAQTVNETFVAPNGANGAFYGYINNALLTLSALH